LCKAVGDINIRRGRIKAVEDFYGRKRVLKSQLIMSLTDKEGLYLILADNQEQQSV
jgi:hypothetical protein